MKSVKCVHCGLVNWADADACKRCGNPPRHTIGEEFGGWAAGADYAPQAAARKRTGLAVASLVLGILSLLTFSLLLVGALTALTMGIVAASRASKQPHLYGGRGLALGGILTSAFSLVMVVPLGIIMAIAIPNLLASRRAANEASAIRGLNELLLAESEYRASVGAGEFGSLEELSGAGLIEGSLARGTKQGYQFNLVATAHTCTVSAVPVDYGRSGRRSFYATCEDGEIHHADKNGLAANSSDPVLDAPPRGGQGSAFGGDSDAQSAPARAPRSRY